MSDWSPLLMMSLSTDSFVGGAERFEQHGKPIPEQMEFGAGDAAILAMSNSALEQDFVVARGVDPSEYAATWPDWDQRPDHALCELFSRIDPEIYLGWVHRLKLMRITPEQYQETLTWRENGFPIEIPEWTEVIFKEFAIKLSASVPNLVPVLAECEYCGSDHVDLVVIRTITYRARTGRIDIEGEERYVPVTEVDEDSTHTSELVCQACGRRQGIGDDDWVLPGISN